MYVEGAGNFREEQWPRRGKEEEENYLALPLALWYVRYGRKRAITERAAKESASSGKGQVGERYLNRISQTTTSGAPCKTKITSLPLP